MAIISTHPIQYNAPFFKELSLQPELSVKVFYTWSQASGKVYDPGFNIVREWDIPLLDGYEYEFIKNIALKPGSGHFWGIVNPSLIKKVREWRPDFILVYGWAFFSHMKLMRRFYKEIPILFRGDSTILDQGQGVKGWLKKKLLTWIYSSVDICLYVGKNNYDYFRKYGVADERLKYLPHVVDNKRFRHAGNGSEDPAMDVLRKQLEHKIGFLFVGKFERKKNPLLLVQAFRQLNDDNMALLFVGQGDLEKDVKDSSTGINGIHFLSFQNQKAITTIYHLADVLVLPSAYNETWGLVVNEAMAAGLAIIVSDKVGCAPDLVEDGINGYIFSSGNSQSLIDKMKVMTGQDLKQMKEASLNKIDHFSIERNVLTLTKILCK